MEAMMSKQERQHMILVGGILFVVFCLAFFAFNTPAHGTPVLKIGDNVVFPCTSVDADGYLEDSDSAWVHVWHDGVGDNAVTYSARTDDMLADWIGEIQYAAGKNLVMFRDAVADIDDGQGDGLYTMAVYLFAGGQGFPTYYSFYLAGTNTNEAQDILVTIEGQTDDIGAAGVGLTAVSIATDGIAAGDFATGAIDADATSSDYLAEIEKECNDALVDEHLDHLMAVDAADVIVDGSAIAQLAAGDEDWSTFDPSTDAQSAIRVQGDAAWVTGGAGGFTADGEDSISVVMKALTLQLANDSLKTLMELADAIKVPTDKLKFDAEDTLVISYSGFALSQNTISTTAMANNTINSATLSNTFVSELMLGDGYEGLYTWTGYNLVADGTIGHLFFNDSAVTEEIHNDVHGITLTGTNISTVAESRTLTDGTETNAYGATHSYDGTYYEVAEGGTGTNANINFYLEFDIGADTKPVSLVYYGRLDEGDPPSGGDDLHTYVYDWDAIGWTHVISTFGHIDGINGSTSADDQAHEIILANPDYVGTGGDVGKVRVAFTNYDPDGAEASDLEENTELFLDYVFLEYQSLLTAKTIVDEWETQSQSDPTGFHINLMEVNSITAAAVNMEKIFDGDSASRAKMFLEQLDIVASNDDFGISVFGSGSGSGAQFKATGANGHGIHARGYGSGAGISTWGGDGGDGTPTGGGDGFEMKGGSSGGNALKLNSQTNHGLYIIGSGGFSGIKTTVSSAGHGLEIVGKDDSSAFYIDAAGDGSGLEISTAGTGKDIETDQVADLVGLFTQTYERIDSVADSLNAHAPHDDNFGGGGGGSISDADMASIVDTLLDRATYPNHTDTTTVGGKIHAMSDSLISQEWATSGGAASITDADMAAIVDSLLNRKSHQQTDTTTVGGRLHATSDSVMSQGWAATGSAAGTGAVSDTIFAVDTTGVDASHTNIPSVWIQARNSSGTLLGEGQTNGSGYVVLGLPQSTSVTLSAFLAGYTWGEKTYTTTSGTEDTDSIMGYAIAIGSPVDPDKIRIYGWIRNIFGTGISGVYVSLEMDAPGDTLPYLAGTGVMIAKTKVLDTTDSDGYWLLDVYPMTDADGDAVIIPESAVYEYEAKLGNRRIQHHKKTIRPAGTTTTAITDIAEVESP